jgi:hypothetical protein
MQLSYRGIPYQKTSLILEMTEGEIGGKYRGREFTYKYPKHIPQIKPQLDLQYFGVAYSKIATPIEKPELVVNHATHNICPVSIRKQIKINDNFTQIHLENIKSNLERRIQVAKAKGDESLVNLLEQEQLHLEFSS